MKILLDSSSAWVIITELTYWDHTAACSGLQVSVIHLGNRSKVLEPSYNCSLETKCWHWPESVQFCCVNYPIQNVSHQTTSMMYCVWMDFDPQASIRSHLVWKSHLKPVYPSLRSTNTLWLPYHAVSIKRGKEQNKAAAPRAFCQREKQGCLACWSETISAEALRALGQARYSLSTCVGVLLQTNVLLRLS